MNEEKLNHFKQKLEDESKLIERELETVGRRNPDRPGDWEAQPKDTDTASTEPDEKADKFEEFEENLSITAELELRLREVNGALSKFKKGSYGVCEIGDHEIEEDRLEANPAARTCKTHLNA